MESTASLFTSSIDKYMDRIIDGTGVERMLALSDLRIDPIYQRGEKDYWKKIAANWEPKAAGRLIVFQRPDGLYYVADGQQRRKAMMAKGVPCWPCIVYKSSGPEEEAAIFSWVNGGGGTHKKVTQREVFVAALVAKSPKHLAIKAAVEKAGLKLHLAGGRMRWPWVGCHSALLDLVEDFGVAPLERALALIALTWEKSDDATRYELVGGVTRLVGHYGDLIEDDRFVRLMKLHPPMKIITEAKQSAGERYANMNRALVSRYNKRLTNPIPEELPYGKRKRKDAKVGIDGEVRKAI